ncbi:MULTISPECIES: helix-turn-helix domain-containing protein [unclassified Frankia]|uniref:TetR/AcrR family transcriptional regulator n=1 Tax=unclassified Frankia TaxID=2632575 RepID=UPI002AD2528B|nr:MULTISPECIES: helix-turn-helix domain-containing protein [unclassified Frankia]
MLDERVEQILDAAYACFTRHGVKRTTMDDIAREAGMSRGAVYQHVRNKEDAFRRLAERLFDAALARARVDVDTGTDLTERLTAVLTAKLDLVLRLWRDSPHAAELLGDNARPSADLEAAYSAAMRDLLSGTIAADLAAADISAADGPGVKALELAEILLALTRGLEADLSDPDVTLRRLRHAVALIVAGLSHTRTEIQETP